MDQINKKENALMGLLSLEGHGGYYYSPKQVADLLAVHPKIDTVVAMAGDPENLQLQRPKVLVTREHPVRGHH